MIEHENKRLRESENKLSGRIKQLEGFLAALPSPKVYMNPKEYEKLKDKIRDVQDPRVSEMMEAIGQLNSTRYQPSTTSTTIGSLPPGSTFTNHNFTVRY